MCRSQANHCGNFNCSLKHSVCIYGMTAYPKCIIQSRSVCRSHTRQSPIRHCGRSAYIKMIGENFLYFATFFLGLMLGVLCDASTLLDATVVKLLILGMLSLLLSGIGGIIGGYVVYFFKRGKFNPTVGIAGVSCVPSTAKVAQKAAAKANPAAFILDYALGANICGVITTAILTGIYITLLS